MVTNHIYKQGGNPKWIRIVYHIHRGIVGIIQCLQKTNFLGVVKWLIVNFVFPISIINCSASYFIYQLYKLRLIGAITCNRSPSRFFAFSKSGVRSITISSSLNIQSKSCLIKAFLVHSQQHLLFPCLCLLPSIHILENPSHKDRLRFTINSPLSVSK